MKKRREKTKKNTTRNLIVIIVVVLVVGILISLFMRNDINKKDGLDKTTFKSKAATLTFKNRVEDLKNYAPEDSSVYVAGWLQVQGTNIDFPILDYTSSDTSMKLDNGWRSWSYRTGENREVLLGHNIVNVSSMPIRDMEILNSFESLMAFVYDDFAQENEYISYTKGNEEEIFKIYAVHFADYGTDDSESFMETEEVKQYIKNAREQSIYDYDIEVDETDRLITLKTCTRYFGPGEKQEIMIDARKIRDDEKYETYEVKKNKNYQKLIDTDSN